LAPEARSPASMGSAALKALPAWRLRPAIGRTGDKHCQRIWNMERKILYEMML